MSLYVSLTGHKGHEQSTLELPKVNDPYVLNAFSVSKEYGFGLVEAPQLVSTVAGKQNESEASRKKYNMICSRMLV